VSLSPCGLLTYSLCSADGNFTVLSGQLGINSNPVPQSPGSLLCNSSTETPQLVAYNSSCITDFDLCINEISSSDCYCTGYGHNDMCFMEYYALTLNSGSMRWRGLQATYWNKFEFVIQFSVTNYAMLTSSMNL
jgi:hypothetical protein